MTVVYCGNLYAHYRVESSTGLYLTGVRGFDPQEVADPPESSAESLWGDRL